MIGVLTDLAVREIVLPLALVSLAVDVVQHTEA